MERRITTSSPQYLQKFHEGLIDTDGELLKNLMTLEGSSNYNVWYQSLECTPGFKRLMQSSQSVVKGPDQGTDTKDWNRLMLWQAYVLGQNRAWLCQLKPTMAKDLQNAIEGCRLVNDAIQILDKACPPESMAMWMIQYQRFHAYSFDYALQTFDEFLHGFTLRCVNIENVRGAKKLTKHEQCSRFLSALGPRFQDWILMISMEFDIPESGAENGKKLCLSGLQNRARAKWTCMNAPQQNRVQNADIRARSSGESDDAEKRQENGGLVRQRRDRRNRARRRKKQAKRR